MRRMFQILAALIAIGVGPQGALAAEPHWPSSLTIGTASPGGTYFVYGEALARMLSRELGILVSTRSTGGRAKTSLSWKPARSSLRSSRSASP